LAAAIAYDYQSLAQLGYTYLCCVNDLVCDLIAGIVQDATNNIDYWLCDTLGNRAGATKETADIFADDPAGFHEAGGAGKFVNELVSLVAGALLACVTEPLTREAGKDDVNLSRIGLKYAIGDLCNIG
jgi:hypothetical protein